MIRCSSPFQAKQLGRDITKSECSKVIQTYVQILGAENMCGGEGWGKKLMLVANILHFMKKAYRQLIINQWRLLALSHIVRFSFCLPSLVLEHYTFGVVSNVNYLTRQSF